jgi:carbon monoxide dehydrogenase subunit G
MEISKTFVVKASPEATWAFLTDLRRVAQCLPGAAITGQTDERTYAGTVTMKVGPVTAAFKGTLRFDKIDAAARTAEIVASGQDTKGKGGADMRMTSRVVEKAPGETEVSIVSDVKIIGTLAQFGRGIVQDVSDQVFDKFVAAARAQLEQPAGTTGVAAAAATPTAGAGIALVPEQLPVSPVATASPPPAPASEGLPPIEVLSTASGVAGRAAGRALRTPIVWVGFAIVVLLLYWLLR